MKCLIITGTEYKGITWNLKEIVRGYLEEKGDEVVEFTLPKDGPPPCTGCKICFHRGEEFCPHKDKVEAIWKAMMEASLLIFLTPVYLLDMPGQFKIFLTT